MSTKIKHISFLFNEERFLSVANTRGMFSIPSLYRREDSNSRGTKKMLTASALLKNEVVRNGDPVITLLTGEKIRVFQGGDPTAVMTRAISILEFHDDISKKTNKKVIKINSSFYDNELFKDFPEW